MAINQRHGFLLIRGTMGTVAVGGQDLDPSQPQWPLTLSIQDEDYATFILAHAPEVQAAFGALLGFLDAQELWG